jgi:hypothetical protein
MLAGCTASMPRIVSFLTSRHKTQPDSGTPLSTLKVAGWITVFARIFANKETIFSVHTLEFNLGYRFDRIFDDDEFQDWPRTVEAGLLACFKQTFAALPPANRREELLPAMDLDQFLLAESYNFRVLKRGG